MTKKAIGASEFNEMTSEEQMRLLHRDGVYIGKRMINDQKVVLFQLFSFYVEVYYRQYRRKIERLVVSTDADTVIPYIDQVDVRDLDRGKKSE